MPDEAFTYARRQPRNVEIGPLMRLDDGWLPPPDGIVVLRDVMIGNPMGLDDGWLPPLEPPMAPRDVEVTPPISHADARLPPSEASAETAAPDGGSEGIADHIVYLFYDEDDRLLYVGTSGVFPSRLEQHRHKAAWWTQTARVEIEHLPPAKPRSSGRRSSSRSTAPLSTAPTTFRRVPYSSGWPLGSESCPQDRAIAAERTSPRQRVVQPGSDLSTGSAQRGFRFRRNRLTANIEAVRDACSCGNPVQPATQGINVTALDQDDKTVASS